MRIRIIDEKDNVAVALKNLNVGEIIKNKNKDKQITITENVNSGNKVALENISQGESIIKYGHIIGTAKCDIEAGTLVHVHNISTTLDSDVEYQYMHISKNIEDKMFNDCFHGYLRGDGTIGIRNEIWIVPTVGCVNHIGRKLAEAGRLMLNGNVDGIYCWEHPYGCSQMGEDQENTRKVIQSLCKHGNAGGVLLLGLGCENLNLDVLGVSDKTVEGKIIRSYNCQDVNDEFETGKKIISEIISGISMCERQLIPLSELNVGVKCGGSDGLSGITANPLIGNTTDLLTAYGATVLMSEVPEMFGAEKILMNRCKSYTVFEKLVDMINSFKSYYKSHKLPVYENPSPGNKKGGITTLEEKSLGCIQKSGSSEIVDVCSYAEPVNAKGVNLIYSPGNDLVSMTAMAIAGAHILLFSTGRGTPVGAIVPTIKISSNTELFEKKGNWIDYDGGKLTSGFDIDIAKIEVMDLIKQVASGEIKTRNERNDIREFAIFKTGVTL